MRPSSPGAPKPGRSDHPARPSQLNSCWSDTPRRPSCARQSSHSARQVAAGYVLFGSSTVFVLTTGSGVNMFVLDQSIGAFVLVKSNLQIPQASPIYSVNEANCNRFPEPYREYLAWAHESGYTSRYIGSMVADVHRTLLKGGLFMYPPTTIHPDGKLRLMYEANPMAMIIENAGGRAISEHGRILEVEPTSLHQRSVVIMGSPDEVGHVQRFIDS